MFLKTSIDDRQGVLVATIINKSVKEVDIVPKLFESILPQELLSEIFDIRKRDVAFRVEEIRLRRDRHACLTTDSGNIFLSYVADASVMEETVLKLCDGSLYAYRETIAKGYLTLSGGIRVGICGRAALERDSVIGVYDISSLNFRIPHKIFGIGRTVCSLIRRDMGGVLIYSSPGVGKTTLLRCVAAEISRGENGKRVAVIDTRGELGFSLDGANMSIDVLEGYPRRLGIEIATRSMSAQLILCDEIGALDETDAILSAQNCGVPLVASAHADNIHTLMRKEGIRRLHRARVFSYYVGISRRLGYSDFDYTVTDWEEAERVLQDSGKCTFGIVRNDIV